MKKMSKILFLVLVSIMLIFTFSVRVNAADEIDYSDYTELEDSSSQETQTEQSSETTTSTEENTDKLPSNTTETVASNGENTDSTTTTSEEQKEKTTNPSNTATSDHVQAGSFQNSIYATLVVITISALVVGYIKLKKYNY